MIIVYVYAEMFAMVNILVKLTLLLVFDTSFLFLKLMRTYFSIIFYRVNLCKEFIDNIRIMFDFTLETSLLYKEEDCQWETFKSLEPAAIANGYREEHPVQLKQEICCESADAEGNKLLCKYVLSKIERF